MPPVRDETVDALKDMVHKLEVRVQELEARLHSADGSTGRTAGGQQMRMVLMGPPGAGTGVFYPSRIVR